ncbi:hypothetical protein DFH07DRAFT_819070, partial [Mycena maculata]
LALFFSGFFTVGVPSSLFVLETTGKDTTCCTNLLSRPNTVNKDVEAVKANCDVVHILSDISTNGGVGNVRPIRSCLCGEGIIGH